MIETLNELANASGVQRLMLSIQPMSETRVAVTIQSILGAEPDNPSEDQVKLRQALAAPVVVEGITGEVDAKIEQILADYVQSVRPKADRLVTNIEKVKESVAVAGSADSGESEKADGDSKSGEASKNDQEDSPKDESDRYASDDAESL